MLINSAWPKLLPPCPCMLCWSVWSINKFVTAIIVALHVQDQQWWNLICCTCAMWLMCFYCFVFFLCRVIRFFFFFFFFGGGFGTRYVCVRHVCVTVLYCLNKQIKFNRSVMLPRERKNLERNRYVKHREKESMCVCACVCTTTCVCMCTYMHVCM